MGKQTDVVLVVSILLLVVIHVYSFHLLPSPVCELGQTQAARLETSWTLFPVFSRLK